MDRYVFLETFGCQMNDDDSDRLLGFLKDINYIRTEKVERADFIIINTCSIRDKAEQKVYSALGRFKSLKNEKPGLVIGVAGCVAQQNGEALLKRAPYLDVVIGTHNIHRIKEILREVSVNKRRLAATEFSSGIDGHEYGPRPFNIGVKASVSIMRGCDNFCTYCIVPYTRGREASRTGADIMNEVSALAQRGVKEITLIGQNVNSYGRGTELGFAGLLRKVCRVEGISRVRFMTSHPKDFSGDLTRLFAEEGKLCPHAHLPAQSGSDDVLKRMKRGYTRAQYLEKIAMLRAVRPDIAITSDIIVGFPGETDRDFLDTMGLINTVRYDNIFSFMYSPRPDTAAAGFDGQVPLEVKSERLRALQAAQLKITNEKSRALVGKTVEVLVEGVGKAGPDEFFGRTSCARAVNFPAGAAAPGSLTDVFITDAYANSLRGALQGSTP
ncbi:MAG: tRNA (N6-isopentenyl adenosine(37)-C2)-methylthiotransferase MiaB [Deltaproteobacteria bacterium]|nr:tRNA (N6-isopentenyl adenosine(37)-C2)-methylthiotransferase MiaB [Deltaproteobacteria bacterium]